jgi:hypothetical protein
MRLVFSVLVLLIATASTQGQEFNAQVPFQAGLAVRIYPRMGWGAPLNGDRIATALHVVYGLPGQLQWEQGSISRGTMELQCADKARDLAILRIITGFPAVMTVSRKPPAIQDQLWYRGLLANNAPTVVRGFYLGEGESDALDIDGWVNPGASGSPVLSDRGEVVGIIREAINLKTVGTDEMTGRAVRELLSLFRPFVRAVDIHSGPCGIK